MNARDTVIGIISGATEVVILQPLLYCKNATQQNMALTLILNYYIVGLGCL